MYKKSFLLLFVFLVALQINALENNAAYRNTIYL